MTLTKNLGNIGRIIRIIFAAVVAGLYFAIAIVNGIESQYEETIDVIRLNLLGSIGREAAAKFRVRVVSTTINLDGTGTVLARQVGVPDRIWLENNLQQ